MKLKTRASNKRTSTKTIGVGMIGCGSRPQYLFKHLVDYYPDCGIQIKALFDPSALSIQKTKDVLKASQAVVHESFESLLKDPAVEWVFISSPNYMHADHVVAAFQAGKDVFCEKPLATNLEDCLRMEKAWKKSGRRFVFGLCLRYSPLYNRVAELLEAGTIGKMVSFEFNETIGFNHGGYIMGNWRRDRSLSGSHMLEKCCHDIDLAQWLSGSLPVRVASFGGLNFFLPENKKRAQEVGKDKNGNQAYSTWFDQNAISPFDKGISIIDNQVMIAELASGVRCSFHTNCNAAIRERRFYILGTHGAIRADYYTGKIEWEKIGFGTKRCSEVIDITGSHGGSDNCLIDSLVKTMLEGKPEAAGMKEAKESAVTCFAVDEAMDTRQVIDLRPLWKKAGLKIS